MAHAADYMRNAAADTPLLQGTTAAHTYRTLRIKCVGQCIDLHVPRSQPAREGCFQAQSPGHMYGTEGGARLVHYNHTRTTLSRLKYIYIERRVNLHTQTPPPRPELVRFGTPLGGGALRHRSRAAAVTPLRNTSTRRFPCPLLTQAQHSRTAGCAVEAARSTVLYFYI